MHGFCFYELESIRGFISALDVTCVSTRHTKNIMRRSKRLPLGIIQFIINCQERESRPMWRVRVEDRALANSYELNKLLLNNDMTLETTYGYVYKLSKII